MNAMSLKAKIRNIAKDKNISAQVVLQNYFFERFLDRLSRSEYQEIFIIKGGLLIAIMAGLDTRSTMDLDATVRSLPLDEKNISKTINDICSIAIDDGITFEVVRIDFIREDDEYGGFRVSLSAKYDTIVSPLSIDITTGDVITPKPIVRLFKSFFDDTIQFKLWVYNTETILAEKVETILRRSVGNTRPRDFYDVYLISKTQKFNLDTFRKALCATAEYRKSTEIISNVSEILDAIEKSAILNNHWKKYASEYSYAKGILFEDIIKAIRDLML